MIDSSPAPDPDRLAEKIAAGIDRATPTADVAERDPSEIARSARTAVPVERETLRGVPGRTGEEPDGVFAPSAGAASRQHLDAAVDGAGGGTEREDRSLAADLRPPVTRHRVPEVTSRSVVPDRAAR